MGKVSGRDIALWRLHSQRLEGHSFDSVRDVVAGLLGVQAENHSQASWAVATRTGGVTASEFGRLYDDGVILRTHVLRPTWHFVTPADIGWLLDLTRERVTRTFRTVRQSESISDSHCDRVMDVFVDALASGPLTRRELGERLEQNDLGATGLGLMILTADAEISGLICSGPRKGNEHTYALMTQRVPRTRRLDRDEALAELALRYFTGHGPATERDLSYWATLTSLLGISLLAGWQGRLIPWLYWSLVCHRRFHFLAGLDHAKDTQLDKVSDRLRCGRRRGTPDLMERPHRGLQAVPRRSRRDARPTEVPFHGLGV